MRKIIAIALTQFRLTLKVKAALAAMFAMPLALIIIFGVLLGGAIENDAAPAARVYPIAVIDEDQTLASRLVAEALGREASLKVQPAVRSELDKVIAGTRVVAGVIIPAGFEAAVVAGRAPALELITSRGSNLEMGVAPIIERAAGQAAGDYFLARKLAGAADEAQVRGALARIAAERAARGAVVTAQPLKREAAKPEGAGMLNHAALGYTVMSVMMSILMMAGAFLYERQHGTWGRLLTTPTDRLSLMAGYILSFFITGMFQFAVLVFGTRLLFRIDWGPLLPLFAVGAATVLASSGMGLFLAGLVRTAEQQQAVGVIFVIATSMLGGLFWPLEILNPTMQRIGHLTPQAWAMDGLTEVALRGGSWGGLVWPLAVLLAIALVFTAVGLRRVRFE
ncbi:MAG TPA: ABC transporter permease [Symbiobacteriaceae bacterium]|nr:ABC transporter permease [Symbiobacteriaceae bacterium]